MRLISLTIPEEEMPLIKELWLYFEERYIKSSTAYPNLNLDTSDVSFIKLIILGICIGFLLAGIWSVFNKKILGKLVRALLSAGAMDKDTAKELDEVGFGENLIIHFALRRSASLRRVVKCVGEEEHEARLEEVREEYEAKRKAGKKCPKFKETPYKLDVVGDKFYVPEKMKYMAEIKFDSKGNSWVNVVLSPIIIFIFYVAALVALPHLLDFLNGLSV